MNTDVIRKTLNRVNAEFNSKFGYHPFARFEIYGDGSGSISILRRGVGTTSTRVDIICFSSYYGLNNMDESISIPDTEEELYSLDKID